MRYNVNGICAIHLLTNYGDGGEKRRRW
jgi:hypothetical protein